MTATTIEARLRDYLRRQQADDRLGVAIHKTIAEALKKFEGKKLTKRSSDAIRAALEARTDLFPTKPICYFPHPGEVHIWGKSSDERRTVYICPQTWPGNTSFHGSHVGEFHLAGFEYSDLCHGQAAEERIAERTLWLDPAYNDRLESIAAKIEAIRTAWTELEALEFDGLRYEARRLTGLKNDVSYKED
jgi:hypothetical protein